MRNSVDVAIIGAGIVGLSTALQIARRSNLSVLVLERARSLGEGSTGASSSICRHRYTHTETIELARDGINAYRHWDAFTGLTDAQARLESVGVLWMGGGEHETATSQQNSTQPPPAQNFSRQQTEQQRLHALGINASVLSDDELQQRFPALNPCVLPPDTQTGVEHDCLGGGQHLLELDGGYVDAQAALQDLSRASQAEGVALRLGCEVAGVDVRGDRAVGVTLASGESIAAGVVLNASGPWCNRVLSSVGLHQRWTFVPTRIQVLAVPRPPEVEGALPVCADAAGGLYFRPQSAGQQLIVGSTAHADEQEQVHDPDAFDRFTDVAFREKILHSLHHRIPSLPYRGRITGYSGLYTVNAQDMHPVVGPTPVEGLFVANGFSGHGFKLAPAIGSLLAQLITGETAAFDTQVSADYLAWDRAPIELASKTVLA